MKRIFSILMLSGLVVIPALQGEKKPFLPSTVALTYCGGIGLGLAGLGVWADRQHTANYLDSLKAQHHKVDAVESARLGRLARQELTEIAKFGKGGFKFALGATWLAGKFNKDCSSSLSSEFEWGDQICSNFKSMTYGGIAGSALGAVAGIGAGVREGRFLKQPAPAFYENLVHNVGRDFFGKKPFAGLGNILYRGVQGTKRGFVLGAAATAAAFELENQLSDKR